MRSSECPADGRGPEAVELGALIEVSEKRCHLTGKTVRIVDLSLDERGRRQDRRMEAIAA